MTQSQEAMSLLHFCALCRQIDSGSKNRIASLLSICHVENLRPPCLLWQFSSMLSHCLYDNRPLLESCGRGCLAGPGKASCVTRCLIGKRVRSNCAQCLGNGFSCALRSCRGQCQRGFASAGCTDCVRRSCGLCSHAGKSLEEGVNQTEISQILARGGLFCQERGARAGFQE